MSTPDSIRIHGYPAAPAWLTSQVWPLPTKTLIIEGRKVAVTDVGQGPVLFFAHVGQWSFLWRDVIAHLLDRFRCVSFDPLGFGLSDRIPAQMQTLDTVRDTIGGIIDQLELHNAVLIMHDLGGVTALAAAASRPQRIGGLVAANTFGWRPTGLLFRTMLAVFGSSWIRQLDGLTGFLPAATSGRFGVGRHLDRQSRATFRRGLDAEARRAMHRLFASARRSPEIYDQAATAHQRLASVPVLTIFGAWGDYLRFRPKWRKLYPHTQEVTIPRGLHFPMSDNPELFASTLAAWHDEKIR